MEILGFDNVFVQVGDLDEGVRFYGDVLRLPVHRRFDAMHTVLFDVGKETPGLGIAAVADPRPGGGKIWLEVADARKAAEELADLGVLTLSPPFVIPTGWTVEVADPWGNVVGLTDYTGMPALGRV